MWCVLLKKFIDKKRSKACILDTEVTLFLCSNFSQPSGKPSFCITQLFDNPAELEGMGHRLGLSFLSRSAPLLGG